MGVYESQRQMGVQRKEANPANGGRRAGANGHDVGAQLSHNAAFKAQMMAVQRKAKPPIEARRNSPLGGHMPTRSGIQGSVGLNLTAMFAGDSGGPFEFAGIKVGLEGRLRATALDLVHYDGDAIGATLHLSGDLGIYLMDEHRAAELILGIGAEAHKGTADDGVSLGWGTDMYQMLPIGPMSADLPVADQRLGILSVMSHFQGHTAGARFTNDTALLGGDGGDRHRTAQNTLVHRPPPGGVYTGAELNTEIVTGRVDNSEAARTDPTKVTDEKGCNANGTYVTQPGPFRMLSKGALTLKVGLQLNRAQLGIEAGVDSEAVRNIVQNCAAHTVFRMPNVPLVRQAAQHLLRVQYGAGRAR